MTLHEFTDKELYYTTLAEKFVALSNASVAERQQCAIALSGGRTPELFYKRLNQSPLPWKRMWWFLGDERWVPATSDTSNERMVKASLGVDRPEFQQSFLSWHMAGEPGLAAKLYHEKLLATVGDPPILDLTLLGLGDDGHTASLFPGTAALEETKRYAVLNQVPESTNAPQRLTMTYPVFNVAREIWFLVSGISKAAMVERLLKRDVTIPSARIQNPNQHLFWLK